MMISSQIMIHRAQAYILADALRDSLHHWIASATAAVGWAFLLVPLLVGLVVGYDDVRPYLAFGATLCLAGSATLLTGVANLRVWLWTTLAMTSFGFLVVVGHVMVGDMAVDVVIGLCFAAAVLVIVKAHSEPPVSDVEIREHERKRELVQERIAKLRG